MRKRKKNKLSLPDDTIRVITTGFYRQYDILHTISKTRFETKMLDVSEILGEDFEKKKRGKESVPVEIVLQQGHMNDFMNAEETKMIKGVHKIGILNVGSNQSLAGGFLSGVSTREGSLAVCSTLYASLRELRDFYKSERARGDDGWATDKLIYSPSVMHMRNHEWELIKPTETDVFTVFLPNTRILHKRGVFNREEVVRIVKERLVAALMLSSKQKVHTIVMSEGYRDFGYTRDEFVSYLEEVLETYSHLFKGIQKIVIMTEKDRKKRQKNPQ
ncbi:hypothetical protein ABD91_20235 [Lysinibacillus sphaericus]|uniref:TIGR02452 family protein n=1 Tax=Lysinibacillus sphaericus TaxID=1421 RepID=UPI0018CE8132|nr:TIGR02452 family protein [Lysinibacillus sphaericus]MBG9693081.1 hypothetical protein [Lysinibacillus sphaericus]